MLWIENKFVTWLCCILTSFIKHVRSRSRHTQNHSMCCILFILFFWLPTYEKYLDILPTKFRKVLVTFRTSNHRLPIETSRWLGIPFDDRRCTFCYTRQLADEMHFVLECKAFSDIRKTFLNTKFCYRPNIFWFCELLLSSKLKLWKDFVCLS